MPTIFTVARFESDRTLDNRSPLEGCEKQDVVMKGKQAHLCEMEELEKIDSLCPEYGPYQTQVAERGVCFSNQQQQQQQQRPPISNCSLLDDFHSEDVSPPVGSRKLKQYPFPLASLELLSNYRSKFKKLTGEKLSNLSKETIASDGKLSTEQIMRTAGTRFINFNSQGIVDYSILMHPYGYALMGLSEEETQDVELAHVLLAAAEKIGYRQYDRASRLLTRCDWISSETGNPVQRLVLYFAKALQERIDRETGRVMFEYMQEEEIPCSNQGLGSSLPFLACHKEIPFCQIAQFTGIQAIMENVGSANKVHLVDLEIRSGVQWIVLMQALAAHEECQVELLKISAVATRNKQKVEETGKRLESYAKSVNLNFSFQVVFVSDVRELREELFEKEANEVVAVYSLLFLRTMISRPYCLDILMGVIKRLKPSIMVVTEVEANHNSASFMNRFIEALFFYSAYFDCLEACMDRNNENRTILEEIFGVGIRNIVATESEERITRNVKIDVWRAFFARFGMVEMEFSESSLYQASLVPKQLACGSSCSLDKNGNCLIIGWKGTPLHSLSAWKFR